MHEALTKKIGALPAKKIIRETARFTGISEQAILSQARTRPVFMARAIAIYIMRVEEGMPLIATGQAMSRDHTSVLNAERRARERMADKEFSALVKEIVAELRK